MREISASNKGYFDDNSEARKDQPESAKAMEMMISDMNEMEDLIKNNYLQSEAKKKEFFKNNPV